MVDLQIELEIEAAETITLDVSQQVTIDGFEVSSPVPIIPPNYGLITYNGSVITVS